jgi:hypothetical protein
MEQYRPWKKSLEHFESVLLSLAAAPSVTSASYFIRPVRNSENGEISTWPTVERLPELDRRLLDNACLSMFSLFCF